MTATPADARPRAGGPGDEPPALAADHLCRRFRGLTAVGDVSLQVAPGARFGIIGPNGAGKTTLFNVLTGIYEADEGEFDFDGAPLSGLKPHMVAERGIARTFQNIRLFANLSALENVMIGRHVRTRAGVVGALLRDRGTQAEERAIEQRALELLDYVGIRTRANGTLVFGMHIGFFWEGDVQWIRE